MNRFLLSSLMATALVTGGVAIAQASRTPAPSPSPIRHDLLDKLDSNKDSVITRAEFTADLDRRFADLDSDKNGVISVAEQKAARDARRNEHINARFTALDTDRNNQISREEFSAGADRRSGPDGAGHFRSGKPGGDHRGHAGGFGKVGFRGDQQADMTKEQFMARPLRLFDMLDSNDDGKITAAERQAVQHRNGKDRDHPGPDRRQPPKN